MALRYSGPLAGVLRLLPGRARRFSSSLSPASSNSPLSDRGTREDVWVEATKSHLDTAAKAVLLVEDGRFGPVRPGGRHFISATRNLRFIMLDKTVLDLEAPFAGGRNGALVAGGAVQGGIGMDDVIYSTAIRELYHRQKPLFSGSLAQEVSDPTYRPFVTVVDASVNNQDSIRVRRLSPNNLWGSPVDGFASRQEQNLFGTDDGNTYFEGRDIRDVKHVLSGTPITRACTEQSPAAHIKDALCWIWPRAHITRRDIRFRFARTKKPALEPEIDGQALLYAKPCAPKVRFAFSTGQYVAGDLEILIQGVPVRVFVNTDDVCPPCAPVHGTCRKNIEMLATQLL